MNQKVMLCCCLCFLVGFYFHWIMGKSVCRNVIEGGPYNVDTTLAELAELSKMTDHPRINRSGITSVNPDVAASLPDPEILTVKMPPRHHNLIKPGY